MLTYIDTDAVLEFSVECYPHNKYSVTLIVNRRLNTVEREQVTSIFKKTFGNNLFIFERLVKVVEEEETKGEAGFNLK